MRLKYLIAVIVVNFLFGVSSLAQTFTVGASGITVVSGTPLFIDSLVLTPSAAMALTSNSLMHTAVAASINGVNGIINQFTFASPVTYSGTAALCYTTSQLNGNPASDLVIAYNSVAAGSYTLNCTSTRDTVNRKVTSSALAAVSLYNLSAVKSAVSVAAITGASGLNVGTTTLLSNTTSGGTWGSTNATLATVNASGLVTGIYGGTDTINYTVTNTCNTAVATKVLNVNDSSIWLGVSNTNWADSTNWSTGIVPTAMVNAVIPAGTFYSPEVITGNYKVKDVSLATGGIVTLDAGTTLSLKGDLYNDGLFTGGGMLKMDTSIAQSITGNGTVANFELDNAAGAAIGSTSKMTIKEVLSLTAGTLTTGDSLTLNSDASTTARIAPLPATGASISGNVKVMQYVPGGYRRYRFWSHPFSSYIPLSQVESYIDVTGSGGAANGFTTTATNAPSAFRYDPLVGNSSMISDPGWRPFTSAYGSTDSNRLNQYQGIRLFFRGAKTEGLGYGTYTPSAVTVGMWGTVNQGNQTVHLTKGSGTYQDYNMVGNPYPSPVDIGTVIYNAKVSGNVVGSAFYVWNPSLGAGGQFQAIFIGTASAIPYYLPAYCSFQVRAGHNGDSLNFTENNKNATATSSLFKTQQGLLSLAVYDANYHLWDMLHISFNNAASVNEDCMLDATKPSGSDFNFYSLSADGRKLAIDTRPYQPATSIPLGLNSGYARDFIIKVEGVSTLEDGATYLHDKLLKQYILLQQGTEYKFSVSEKSETQGNNRFELCMRPATVIAEGSGLSFSMFPNPATDEVTVNFKSYANANCSLRILDVSGACVHQQDFGLVASGSNTVSLSRFAAGIYVVEFTSGTEKVVQRLVKD